MRGVDTIKAGLFIYVLLLCRDEQKCRIIGSVRHGMGCVLAPGS